MKNTEDDDEDEDDYMSDKFLQNENNPGLMPKMFLRKNERKEQGVKKYSKLKRPSKATQENESRKEKLETALDESNKGFAMLAKMGFQKGMGLGKEGQGISEPIPLDLKAGRSGLGKEAEEERKRKQRLHLYVVKNKRRKEDEENLRGDFKSRMKVKLNERQMISDFYKSQTACHHLDTAKNIVKPVECWYWPSTKKDEDTDSSENDDDDDDDDDTTPSVEKLGSITVYLRTGHFYCIWCAIQFNDYEDVKANCPGNTFEDHQD